MRQDWGNVGTYYTGESLQTSGQKGRQIFASAGARAEFGWLVDKIPQWAGCDLDLITDLDITGGIDPTTLDDAGLEAKVHEFVAKNSSLFEKFTEESLSHFTSGAKKFARYGADGAQCFRSERLEESCNVLFIQSVSRRDFPQISQEGLGCTMRMSSFDDAAITVMHECGHLLKQHSYMDQAEALRNETEAEGLMVTSFADSVREGHKLDPKSLQTRLAFRSLQSMIWNGRRDIEKINDPLGSDEGFFHGMSAALSLTSSPLTREQAVALLRAPIQVNTLTHWIAGDDGQDRRHYFSAMSALYSGGDFGENTLAAVYVGQALEACQVYAREWLDKDLIADFESKLMQTASPKVEWDRTDDFFQPQRGKYFDPTIGSP